MSHKFSHKVLVNVYLEVSLAIKNPNWNQKMARRIETLPGDSGGLALTFGSGTVTYVCYIGPDAPESECGTVN